MAVEMTVADHLRRVRELELEAANFRNIWSELQEYVTPWRDPVNNTTAPGQKQTHKIFDSTASSVTVLAASAVHGLTMPAGTKWFAVKHPDFRMNDNVKIGSWLEMVTKKINDAFQSSNLPQESQELIYDLLVFGTGCMYWELKEPSAKNPFPGLRFRTMPPGSYVAGENADGHVDTIYRKFKLSACAIVQRWGDKSGKEVLKCIEDKKPDEKFEIIHGVYPRNPKDIMEGNRLTIPKEKRPFEGIWLVSGKTSTNVVGTHGMTQIGTAHELRKEGLFEFPFLVPRWRKMSGETYGRSPGIDSLPDIRTLNKAVELRLKAWALAIGPPLAASDRGVIGDVRLVPFGRINTKGDPRQAVMPLDIGANFNVANFQEEQLRDQLRRAFFIDQLQSHASQGLSPKSATEVSISFELMMRILGPVASRLQVELLMPLIRNTFRMMQRIEGFFGPAPDPTLDESSDIGVAYEGPLARAQSITEVDAVTRYLQVTLPIADSHPEIDAWVDYRELGRTLAIAVSLPKQVMKSREQVDAETQAQQQAQQEQSETADLLGGAEVLNKIAPAAIAGNQLQQR